VKEMEEKSTEHKGHSQTIYPTLTAAAAAILVIGLAFAAVTGRDTRGAEAQFLADELASAIKAAADGPENRIIEFDVPSKVGQDNYSLRVADNAAVVVAGEISRSAPLAAKVYPATLAPGATVEISKYGDWVVLAPKGSLSRGWAWVRVARAENGVCSISSIHIQDNWWNENHGTGQYSIAFLDSQGTELLERLFEPAENTTLLVLPWISIVDGAEFRQDGTLLDNLAI